MARQSDTVIFSFFNANQEVHFLNHVKTFQLYRKKRYICPFFLIPSQEIRGEKRFKNFGLMAKEKI